MFGNLGFPYFDKVRVVARMFGNLGFPFLDKVRVGTLN